MTDTAEDAVDARAEASELILYSRPGCHLCDEARELAIVLLEERRASGLPAPTLVERDISSDPDLERQFFTTIPVLEVAGRRLELATSASKIRRLLEAVR
jgi:hypothetical protein